MDGMAGNIQNTVKTFQSIDSCVWGGVVFKFLQNSDNFKNNNMSVNSVKKGGGGVQKSAFRNK